MSAFSAAGCRMRQFFWKTERHIRGVKRQSCEEGHGAVYSTAQLIRENRLGKSLLVTDAGAGPWTERLRQILEDNDIPFSEWSGASASPTADDAEALAKYAEGEGCGCFIVLGGPETVDLAKAAAVRIVRVGKSIESMAGYGRVGRGTAPVIVIPTAAGSGRESLSRVSLGRSGGERISLEDRSLMPGFVICDPALIADTPRPLLARCVAEGLCLAIEAYISRYADENTRLWAGRAVRGFFEAAEPCWNSGGIVSHRSMLMEASRLAGYAASASGAGYAYAIAEAASGFGAPFDGVCAAALPLLLEKYGPRAASALASLSEQAGIKTEGTRSEKASALISSLRRLAFRINIPELSDPPEPERLAAAAALAASAVNPVWACPEILTAEDCGRILRAAYQDNNS